MISDAEKERDELRAYVNRLETTIEEFDQMVQGEEWLHELCENKLKNAEARVRQERWRHVEQLEARLRAAEEVVEAARDYRDAAHSGTWAIVDEALRHYDEEVKE